MPRVEASERAKLQCNPLQLLSKEPHAVMRFARLAEASLHDGTNSSGNLLRVRFFTRRFGWKRRVCRSACLGAFAGARCMAVVQ